MNTIPPIVVVYLFVGKSIAHNRYFIVCVSMYYTYSYEYILTVDTQQTVTAA